MPELDLGPFTAENEARICELVTGARRHGLSDLNASTKSGISQARGVQVSAGTPQSRDH